MLYGIGLLHSVVGLKTLESPGNSFSLPPFVLARTTLIRELGCASKCWDNSKYVSTCVQANEIQCLCEDAEFQSVCLNYVAVFHLECIADTF